MSAQPNRRAGWQQPRRCRLRALQAAAAAASRLLLVAGGPWRRRQTPMASS